MMDRKLEAITDELDKTTGEGRDLDRARQLADTYVGANPEKFNQFKDLDERALTRAVDVFRAAGMDEQVALIETWVRHRFEPQNIGGPARATVRVLAQ